ncbi:MAG: hypothetical protein ACTSR8_00895 [Promethearchaeota archaeon]
MILNQLSVFLPNKPGQLSNFIELLKDNKIFIKSITVAESEDYGLILMLVDKVQKCIKLLEEKDLIYSTTEVVAVKLSDNVGQLFTISKLFGENNVNIEYLYSTAYEEMAGITFALTVFRLNNNERGIEILRENRFDLLEEK